MIIQRMTQAEPRPTIHPQPGAVRLSHLGVIRAVGVDAATFLQGQLTQDVLTIGHGAARLAAFCNAKGRMQASFVVFKTSPRAVGPTSPAGAVAQSKADEPNEFLMVCSADVLAQTLKRLSLFVMRAKVKLTDASDELLLYGLSGIAINSIASSTMQTWTRTDIAGATTVQLYPAAGIERALWCAPVGTPHPSGPALSLAYWLWLEVQSGIVTVTQPIFEAFVPQMLNYESIGGVSFKKGCYPGQEVVARSQFRGTLKRRAYLVHGDLTGANQPAVGQEVFHTADAEQACGLVASYGANPTGGFDAMVSMQTSAAAGGRLTLGTPHGPELTLRSLPYPLLEDI